jgi:hypothetical protein
LRFRQLEPPLQFLLVLPEVNHNLLEAFAWNWSFFSSDLDLGLVDFKGLAYPFELVGQPPRTTGFKGSCGWLATSTMRFAMSWSKGRAMPRVNFENERPSTRTTRGVPSSPCARSRALRKSLACRRADLGRWSCRTSNYGRRNLRPSRSAVVIDAEWITRIAVKGQT